MSLFASRLPFDDLLETIRGAMPEHVQAYLVGGAVRDLLLERPTHDLDFVILGQDVLGIGRRVANVLGAAYYPLDVERETARVILQTHGQRRVLDFAAPRGPDLESDLIGRDFTINAMAIDLSRPGVLIDPLKGAQDLHHKWLRACSAQSFSNDPVRILRAVRQSVDLDLRIAPESKNWLRQAVPLLARVSVERQRDELFRILGGKKPATALRVLDVFGVLNQLLPELAALRALEQPPPHRYDAWEHTFQVAQKLGGVLNVLALEHNPESAASWALGLISLRLGRFRRQVQQHLEKSPHPDRPLEALLVLAALYHDSGKAETRQADQHGRVHFYRHEEWSERLAILRANQLRLSNLEAQRLGIIVRHHMRPFFLAQAKEPPSRRAIYRFFRDCGEAGVDVCLLSLADSLATYGPALPEEVWISHIDTVRALLSAYWETKEEQIAPPVLLSGHDLLEQFELSPGPHIGELLEALREAQAMGDVTGRLQALQFVEEWLERSGKNS